MKKNTTIITSSLAVVALIGATTISSLTHNETEPASHVSPAPTATTSVPTTAPSPGTVKKAEPKKTETPKPKVEKTEAPAPVQSDASSETYIAPAPAPVPAPAPEPVAPVVVAPAPAPVAPVAVVEPVQAPAPAPAPAVAPAPKPVPKAAPAPSNDGYNWSALAQCESGGDPTAVSPGGLYHGLYQFSPQTWAAVGGSGLPSQASAAEQTMRAQKLAAQATISSQWPVCSANM